MQANYSKHTQQQVIHAPKCATWTHVALNENFTDGKNQLFLGTGWVFGSHQINPVKTLILVGFFKCSPIFHCK